MISDQCHNQVVGEGRHEVGVLLLTDASCPCTSFPGPLLPFPSLCPKCWDVQAHHDLSILCPVPNDHPMPPNKERSFPSLLIVRNLNISPCITVRCVL